MIEFLFNMLKGVHHEKTFPVYTDRRFHYGQTSNFFTKLVKGKGKVIPLQARCGPEDG
jgi:hypothetical protein